jgi:riboflavin biosynthesis pyrimidine reductase
VQTLLPEHIGTMSPAGVADAHGWPTDGLWVRALMLATADGAAAADSGLSGEISSAGDRLLFATIRGMADVILVGAQTIRQEGYSPIKPRPELVGRRIEAEQEPVPRVAIITKSGQLNVETPLFTESVEPPIIFVPESIDEQTRVRLSQAAEVVALGSDSVSLDRALKYLSSIGLKRVVCEGGPTLLGALAAEALVDEICLTITPLLSGGSYGEGETIPRILGGPVLPRTPQRMRLVHVLEDSGTLFLRYVLDDEYSPAG